MKRPIRSLVLIISIFMFLISDVMRISVKGQDIVNDVDSNTKVSYQVSIKNKGWQEVKSDGEESNIPSADSVIESLKINYANNIGLKLKYQVYNETLGWQSEVNNDEAAGTAGKNIKAIRINILNKNLEKQKDYSVYYRVYASDKGWLQWVKDGDTSGEINNNASVESIEVCIAKSDTEKYNKMEFLLNNYSNNSVIYQTHVAKLGDQKEVSNGEMAGTTNRGLRAEAIRIKYDNNLGISVKYQACVEGNGWQNETCDGGLAGTKGQAKSLQALKIWLEDENGLKSSKYSINYRVCTDNGWQQWTKDGGVAGTENQNKIQAIEIYVDTVSNAKTSDNQTVKYSAHVQKLGDQQEVKDGEVAGTVGRSLSLQAVRITYDNSLGIKVKYRAHVAHYGWQDYKNSGEVAGTKGQNLPMEAIQIYLEDQTGKKSEDYSVYYRAHVAHYGWQKWVKDNAVAGTTGQATEMQAVEICIVKKGTSRYCQMEDLCNSNFEKLTYKVHASKIGWENEIANEAVGGSANINSNNLEAVNLSYSSSIGLSIKAQAHVSKIGWTNEIKGNDVTIGTVGQALPVEAVKLNLVDANGKESDNYSIYYRVYAGFGWMGWAKNGAQAGTTGMGLKIKAIQICIRKVGTDECIQMERQVNYKAAMTPVEEKLLVRKDQLIALGWKNVDDNMVKECNTALKKFDINNPARIRHFISQCSYESGLGKYTKELSSGNQYDGRRDLGNIYQGDGAKYKGAGYIQVTGRSNYQSFCNFIGDGRVMEGCSYVSSRYPWTISAYWWYRNNMNSLADRGASVTDITRKVNGGTRGLSTRIDYYNRCCNVFN